MLYNNVTIIAHNNFLALGLIDLIKEYVMAKSINLITNVVTKPNTIDFCDVKYYGFNRNNIQDLAVKSDLIINFTNEILPFKVPQIYIGHNLIPLNTEILLDYLNYIIVLEVELIFSYFNKIFITTQNFWPIYNSEEYWLQPVYIKDLLNIIIAIMHNLDIYYNKTLKIKGIEHFNITPYLEFLKLPKLCNKILNSLIGHYDHNYHPLLNTILQKMTHKEYINSDISVNTKFLSWYREYKSLE